MTHAASSSPYFPLSVCSEAVRLLLIWVAFCTLASGYAVGGDAEIAALEYMRLEAAETSHADGATGPSVAPLSHADASGGGSASASALPGGMSSPRMQDPAEVHRALEEKRARLGAERRVGGALPSFLIYDLLALRRGQGPNQNLATPRRRRRLLLLSCPDRDLPTSSRRLPPLACSEGPHLARVWSPPVPSSVRGTISMRGLAAASKRSTRRARSFGARSTTSRWRTASHASLFSSSSCRCSARRSPVRDHRSNSHSLASTPELWPEGEGGARSPAVQGAAIPRTTRRASSS